MPVRSCCPPPPFKTHACLDIVLIKLGGIGGACLSARARSRDPCCPMSGYTLAHQKFPEFLVASLSTPRDAKRQIP
eukprot:8819336-Pyramimonas_sp.AAC.1